MNIVNLDKTAIESIFPFVIEEERDCIVSGGNYIRVIAITQYPDEAKNNNWLSDLKRMKGNIAIVQHIAPASDTVMIEYYNRAIKNKKAEQIKCFDPKRQHELEKEIQSALHQLELTMDNKSGFVYFYTYILMQATDKKTLDNLEERVMMILAKLKLKGVVPYKCMKEAYLSCFPLQNNQLEEYTYQMSNTDAAASFYLFDDNELCELVPGAVIEGINERTNSYIAVNYNNRAKSLNKNKLIIGTSGIGKTTYTEHDLLDDIAKGVYLYILDPEDEYSALIKRYGGVVVEFGSSGKYIINPLEFFSSVVLDDDERVEDGSMEMSDKVKMSMLIKQKIQRLVGFWKQRKSNISETELAIIDIELTKLFEDKGFYDKKVDELKHEDFPILEELLAKMKNLKKTDKEKYEIIKDFLIILEADITGSSSIFNGYTNVDLTNRTICFNLKALQTEKKMQGACYYNLFTYLWDEITVNYLRAKKENWKEYEARLIADEFHFILQNEEACDFFFQAFKRFRKYSAGATIATQQIVDLLRALETMDIGAAITQNAYTKVFFGMDNKGVEDLIDKLALTFSQKEIALLKGKSQGKAIFIHGNKRVFLENRLPQEELRLFNPAQYKETYRLDPLIQPDYKNKITISLADRAEIAMAGGNA